MMSNINRNAAFVILAVWLLGLCVGGFFGYRDGQKAGRDQVQVHCKYCHHELRWE
jgi:hypothetical protein